MTRYNKLVRDNIPEIIKKNGGIPVTHIADEKEYWEKLKEKLAEEVAEFQKDENVTELADILEIIDAICDYKKLGKNEIRNTQAQRATERGKFEKRIILEESWVSMRIYLRIALIIC